MSVNKLLTLNNHNCEEEKSKILKSVRITHAGSVSSSDEPISESISEPVIEPFMSP